MTEKRYILSHNGKEDGILDKTNDKGYYGFELARLVNELSEENEQLKQQMTRYDEICEKICNWDFDEIVKVLDAQKETEKENEQLKREVKRLKCINKQLEERLDKDIALNMDCGDVE